MTTLLSVLVLAMGPLAVPADAPALCTDQPAQVEMAFDPGIGEQSACNATADCTEGPDVNCSGNSTCNAVDQDCPYTRGWVECDGNRTYCTICPHCPLYECRQGCNCPGGVSVCVDIYLCECECVYQ